MKQLLTPFVDYAGRAMLRYTCAHEHEASALLLR